MTIEQGILQNQTFLKKENNEKNISILRHCTKLINDRLISAFISTTTIDVDKLMIERTNF